MEPSLRSRTPRTLRKTCVFQGGDEENDSNIGESGKRGGWLGSTAWQLCPPIYIWAGGLTWAPVCSSHLEGGRAGTYQAIGRMEGGPGVWDLPQWRSAREVRKEGLQSAFACSDAAVICLFLLNPPRGPARSVLLP